MTATTTTSAAPTTVDINDHLAAAAYLMKHHATSALVVVRGEPLCIISEADLAAAAAHGTDLERTRVFHLVSWLAGRHLTCG
jgi:CBS domain-containing protein